MLDEAGLHHRTQHRVRHHGRVIARVDIAFVEARLAVEVDGFAWHRTPRQLAADHERHNRLQLAGWRVLRISVRQLRSDPQGVVAQVKTALAS